jgi:hypothetical protein
MRAKRALLLAFFAYVVLDLACPLVPGAFSFDPDESVDAVSAHRLRPPAVPRVVAPTFAAAPVRVFVDVATHAAAPSSRLSPVGWQSHAGPDRTAASDPVPSVEDD